MSKKARIILASLALLATSIVLLIVFFVQKDKNSPTAPLSITASEQRITKNQTVFNFYTLSNTDAKLEFSVSQEGIIEINENYLKGIKAGLVEVTITASLGEKVAKTQFNVYVFDNSYTYEITTLSNCSFANDKLYIQGSSCQFSISVYNKLGLLIENSPNSYSATNGAILSKQMNVYRLEATSNCDVTFTFQELEITFVITIIVTQ